MPRHFLSLSLLAILIAFAPCAALAQPARDFQLPPQPEPTQQAPQPQGPVDAETGPVVPTTRPATQPTARPTPAPQATATPAPQPTQSAPAPRQTPQATPTSAATRPSATPAPQAQPQATPQAEAPSAGEDEALAGDTVPLPDVVTPSPAERTTPVPTRELTASDDASGGAWLGLAWWAWLLALVLAAITLVGAVQLLRSRLQAIRQPKPENRSFDEKPLREVTTHSFLSRADANSLAFEAYVVRLDRTMMNATISYRVSFVNRGREPISMIEICGDLTSAHGKVPTAQQIADPTINLPRLHTLQRLEPGQRCVLRGEMRLPLSDVRAIRQGSVPVFVPLVRFVVKAASLPPRAYTYAIGTRPAERSARPTPFRLDEGPRSYAQVSTRALG